MILADYELNHPTGLSVVDAPNQPHSPNPPVTVKDRKVSLHLKGSLLTLTVLELHHYDHQQFNEELSKIVKQAPNFFSQIPVVLSLEKLEDSKSELDFIEILQVCHTYGLHPMAIRGGNENHQISAMAAGLPQIPGSKSRDDNSRDIKDINSLLQSSSKIITQPVRSGQQIYAPGGDLIILSSVGMGAEVLADGNIHVYGALRGRALAGVKGNREAYIFCSKLEPELLSIAGHYKISEDLKLQASWSQPAKAWLKGTQLHIAPNV